MSRILRYEEITTQHPAPEVFNQGVEDVRASLHELCNRDFLQGAALVGSAVVGDANPQSDIDLLVMAQEKTPDFIERIRSLTLGVYRATGIPMDVNCYRPDELQSGNHYYQESLIYFMRQHTQNNPQNIIGANPLDIIQPPQNKGVIAYADNYFADRADDLERVYTNGFVTNIEGTLETVLNLPHRLGRLSLSALEIKGFLPPNTISSSNKQHIMEAVMRTFGATDFKIGELYSQITEDYRNYPKLVREVSEKQIQREEYQQILEATLISNLPKSVALARLMQHVYRDYAHLAPTTIDPA